MALYLIKRNFKDISEENLGAAAKTSKQVCSTISGVKWVRSYLAEQDGEKITYCIYEAPDEATVRQQAEQANLPCDEVTLLAAEIDPASV